MDDNNPLLKALPPATDYLSYLTILEYNLTTDHLPTLHTVLQDPDLTANIGWDLVHLLLPLLPASYQCLQDVARLGNPREVVLKVAELLEALAIEDDSDHDSDRDRDSHGSAADAPRFPRAQQDHHGTTEQRDMSNPTHRTLPKRTSSSLVQFTTLIEMLAIVHPRIKTKYPSRFLSTSLQAILPAYRQVAASLAATDAVLALIKALSGPSRPKLPPRKSSTAVVVLENAHIAPDPEGRDEVLAPEELALQNRLLQSFLSYIIEDCVSSMPSIRDTPGLAWSCRLEEKLRPQKMVPGRESYSKRFTDDEGFHERDTIIGQMVALARDIRIRPTELLSTVTGPGPEFRENDDDFPSSASDVQLSHTGSLYLLSAMVAASALFDVPSALPAMQLFPDYASMLGSLNAIGMEKEALVDAILFLGSYIISTEKVRPPDGDVFHNMLQRISLLSASSPSAALRYNSHTLTSRLLRSHPSDLVRHTFIRDTLEHCPYENLKASAVGWLKEEILQCDEVALSDPCIFSLPETLSSLAPFLFLDPRTLPGTDPCQDYPSLQAHHSFYLAVLNFYWLLLSSQPLFVALDIQGLTVRRRLRDQFLGPLMTVVDGSRAQLVDGNGTIQDEDEMVRNEAEVMRGILDQVDTAMTERGL